MLYNAVIRQSTIISVGEQCWQVVYCQGLPKPKQSSILVFILSVNASYVREPNDLGNMILSSHVDTLGRHNSSVKWIFGVQLKPAAGSFVDSEKN